MLRNRAFNLILFAAALIFASGCGGGQDDHAQEVDDHAGHDHAVTVDSHDGHDHAAEADSNEGHDHDDATHDEDEHDGHDEDDAESHEGHDHDADEHGEDGHDGDDTDAGHEGHDHDAEDDDHDVDAEDSHEGHDHEAVDDHADVGNLIAGGEAWEGMVGLEYAEAQIMPLESVMYVPGRIAPHPDRIAIVSPFIDSSVNNVFANVGENVKKGDVLICLTSPEIGMLRAECDKADAEREISRTKFERTKKLYEEEVLPAKAFQEAELDLKIAEVNYQYSRKKLLALGIGEAHIETPPTGHSDAVGSTMHVESPLSGRIVERSASNGQKVGPGDRLFEIIDLSTVRLEIDIFEKDIRFINEGITVRARVSAWPGEIFRGTVTSVGSKIDPVKKTITVLADIKNPGEKLKPGMFADTVIAVAGKKDRLVVPRAAVLDDENLNIVFLKEGPDYHRHVVVTGVETDEYIEIVDGIGAGSIVVTKGNYQLKSKQQMSEIDPHAGHNH